MYEKLLTIFLVSILIVISGCTGKDTNTEKIIPTENKSIDNKNIDTGKIIGNGQYGYFKLTLELEKDTFKKGENINAVISLKNNGNQSLELRYIIFDIDVNLPEEPEIGSISIIPEDSQLEDVIVTPGDPIIKKVTWDQTYQIDDNKENMNVGEYSLIAYVDIESKDQEQYSLQTDPVMINIEE